MSSRAESTYTEHMSMTGICMARAARFGLAALLLCAGACSKSSDSEADGGAGPVQVQARAQALLAGVDGYPYGEIFRVSHTANGAVDLTQFQVQVTLDTATEIAAGRMRSDCADLRVFAGNGCTAGTPASFWVADGTCNKAATSIWLGLPSVLAGSVTSFAIYWGDLNAASLSNGSAVFPIFFDDFNVGALDTNKWNVHAPAKLTQSGGKVTTSGGATAIWTKNKVMTAGQTVFGVGTNAQSAGGADIEYGAATLVMQTIAGQIHFSNRKYTGLTYMSWDETIALIGRSPTTGSCLEVRTPQRWANAPGDGTWFQTEFFYEFLAGSQTRFGIYDKFGVKKETVGGSASCIPPATESAYYQWDHDDGLPNPISSIDYAYVRKYANPDPMITNRTRLANIACIMNGQGPCTVPTASADCASGACSSNASVCIPPLAGACYADADCGAGQYCDRADMACTTKLALDAALPADGFHDTCPSNNNNAACASGRCNATSSTCAADNGSACSTATACVVNVCDSDNKCGYASAGSCTAQTASVCRSSCGVSNVCLPPSGCDRDTGCVAAQHCDLATLGCVADLADGVAIPASHGSCGGSAGSVGAALDVCSSGHCNETANTCAAANGGSCSTAAACESGVCDLDGNCGYPNGAGPCNASSQAAVCRSQTCSPNGNVCVPAAGSCWVDADCTNGKFCHRDTFTCTNKLAAGASLPADDLHETCTVSVNAACATGACNPETLTCAGLNSESCTAPSECTTDVCDQDAKCGYASGGGSCVAGQAAPQCRSGVCGNGNVCIPSGGCSVDSDCGAGKYCVIGDLQCAPVLANGSALPAGHGTCSQAGPVGSAATACLSGTCNPITNTCAGANAVTSCESASQCIVNVCGANGQCGRIEGEAGCNTGEGGVCQSGTCSPNTGVCIPTGAGRCWGDGDCADGKYCHRLTFTCTDPLAQGSQLPGDSLHNACPPSEVNAACESGTCNRTTHTCAAGFLSDCEQAADCVSNVCDDDGKCGYANGNGPCDADTQERVCRSGICNNTSLCIPSGGCAHDSDCEDHRYCRAADFTCALDLVNGSPLPEAHGSCGGSGSHGDAEAGCVSGACNAITGTCAGPNTETECETAAQCVNNICGTNQRCGYGNGTGSSCTDENAATSCQSGECSANGGSCVPQGEGKCWVDTDCADSSYCHRATFTCTTRLVAGSVLPSDGLHASCSQTGMSRACATGLCDSGSQRCVAVNGASCEAPEACLAQVCGSNDMCGYDVGEGPCSEDNAAQLCQSGACAGSGVCVPQGDDRCWIDVDCTEDSYCNRGERTCRALVAAGAAVPEDGLHNGCSEGTNAACTTGLCSNDSGLCVASNNASCESDSACKSSICGSNGKCGHADGAGPCTEDNAADTCQSEKCSPQSNVCVGGDCWIDSDCLEIRYCDREQQTCRERIGAGAPVPPGDGLHMGCVDGVSMACSTGLCNADSGLCVASNNASCESSDACASGVCGSNDMCGHALGEGPCSADDAAASCQSGQCSPHSEVCITGDCWEDLDCAEGNYCDREEQTCLERIAAGAPVPPGDGLHLGCIDGMSEACSTGLCNAETGLCVAGNNVGCIISVACASSICGGNGFCGHDVGEGPCTAENAGRVCQSGVCASSGVCIPEGEQRCWSDTDCVASSYCNRAERTCRELIAAGSPVVDDGLHIGCSDGINAACSTGLCSTESGLCVAGNKASCTNEAACASSICGGNGMCGHADGEGPCSARNAAGSCQSGKCSPKSKVCVSADCWADGDCAEGSFCDRDAQACRARVVAGEPAPDDELHGGCSDGTNDACSTGLCSIESGRCVADNKAACESGEGCLSAICGGNGLCGYADGEGPCSADNAADSCQSGKCSPNSEVCVTSDCWFDADCAEGSYCDRAEQTCRERVAAGAPFPNDGLHAGCVDGLSDACSSGLCNADRGLCVSSNNISCDTSDVCASSICGGNGLCGHADGEGPCSVDDAADSCQSGKCSANGEVCISGECWVDSDCASGEFCDRSAQACKLHLSPGASLPDDGLHDSCVNGESDACASGRCEGNRCVEATNLFGISGGGGCSATGNMQDPSAGISLLLAALLWLSQRRRRCAPSSRST